MKEEEKELLLKDLSARLPYGVKMNHIADDEVCPIPLIGINEDYIILGGNGFSYVPVEHYKPYLFPLENITKEIEDEIYQETGLYDIKENQIHIEVGIDLKNITKLFNILNKYHLDINNLIPKNLAIDCTNLNIY